MAQQRQLGLSSCSASLNRGRSVSRVASRLAAPTRISIASPPENTAPRRMAPPASHAWADRCSTSHGAPHVPAGSRGDARGRRSRSTARGARRGARIRLWRRALRRERRAVVLCLAPRGYLRASPAGARPLHHQRQWPSAGRPRRRSGRLRSAAPAPRGCMAKAPRAPARPAPLRLAPPQQRNAAPE